MGDGNADQGSPRSFLPWVLARGLSALGFARSADAQNPAPVDAGASEQARPGETSRARLVATVLASFDDVGIPYYSLRLINRGEAQARAIVVSVDGLRPAEHPALSVEGAPSDSQSLSPHSYLEWPLTVKAGSHPSFTVEMTWVDERGVPGSYRGKATI